MYDPDRRLAALCNVDVAQDLFAVEDGKVGEPAGALLCVCCLEGGAVFVSEDASFRKKGREGRGVR